MSNSADDVEQALKDGNMDRAIKEFTNCLDSLITKFDAVKKTARDLERASGVKDAISIDADIASAAVAALTEFSIQEQKFNHIIKIWKSNGLDPPLEGGGRYDTALNIYVEKEKLCDTIVANLDAILENINIMHVVEQVKLDEAERLIQQAREIHLVKVHVKDMEPNADGKGLL